MTLSKIVNELKNGNIYAAIDNKKYINARISDMIDSIKNNDLSCMNDVLSLIEIGNIIYNNTDLDDDDQVIENGVYDLLIEFYNNNGGIAPVGAIPINTNDISTGNKVELRDAIIMHESVDDSKMLFNKELYSYPYTPGHYYNYHDYSYAIKFKPTGGGRLTSTHDHPNLVGTIKKAKYILIKDAERNGIENDSASVCIFERDFFRYHFEKGYINGGDLIKGIISLKYDGMSIEATLQTVSFGIQEKVIIVSAKTRGDAIESISQDVTHILYGYEFYNADPELFRKPLGVKFEAVMSYIGLRGYNDERERNYKNPRSAISSIFNYHQGYKYSKYIILVPLETDIKKDEECDRLAEIEFMNQYLNTGEYFRCAYIEGDYLSALYQVKKFTDDAELIRSKLPIMYDGVVFEYLDSNLREALGRKNAVNMYSMAIKFNPLEKRTIFRGYNYTVGVNGVVTPLIYFDPIEFYGGIHNHTSGHSYARFKELSLAIGDELLVKYVNDVMPYVYKVKSSGNKVEEFITNCPFCGNKLILSKSGKTIIDTNIYCPERQRSKMVNMMSKLNLKNFAEASFDKLPFRSFKEMINATDRDVVDLGEANSIKFLETMYKLQNESIEDYKLLGALGFPNAAVSTWKIICKNYSIHDLLYMYENLSIEEFVSSLTSIKHVGSVTAETIVEYFEIFKEDIYYISGMRNIKMTKGNSNGKVIRISGFRDDDFVNELCSYGLDVSYGSVTKSTKVLLVPYIGFESTKTKKAKEYGIPIVEVSAFKNSMDSYV